MTIELLAPFRPYIGAGGVLSVSTGVSEQAIYWELVSWDPVTLTEGVAYGSLRYSVNKTDKAGFATNVYIAPTDPGLVGKVDRVKVKCGEAYGVDFVSQSLSPSVSPSKSPSLSPSLSPSMEADPPNEAFLYHFDGSIKDTGDFDIVLNPIFEPSSVSPSPSASGSISPSSPPGNDFSSDSRIIEFWRFENNLTAGKAGNDLTASAGGVGYQATNPLEGSYSLDLESGSGQWAYRNDADLSAGFPLKNGDTTKKVSWACRIRMESYYGGYTCLISKYDYSVSNLRSLALVLYTTGVRVLWGYNNGANAEEFICTGLTLSAGRDYYIGLSVDGVNKNIVVRIYDKYHRQTYTWEHTFTNELNISTAPFVIGNFGNYPVEGDYDGLIDEVVIVNDLLSIYEFDSIREDWFGHRSASPSLSPSLSPSISPSESPSASPSIRPYPFTYANGIAKANSAIVMDGTFAFQTEPSENLYPHTGNKCFLFETVFQIDDPYNEEWAYWPLPGMPYNTHDDLPFLFLEMYGGDWSIYFEAANGYISIYEETTIVPGNWYHIIAQFDAVSSATHVYGQVYINGVLLLEYSYTKPPSYPEGDPDNRFDIGYYSWYYDGTSTHFKGKLDLCRMITNIQPWTPEEVAARYAAILAGA